MRKDRVLTAVALLSISGLVAEEPARVESRDQYGRLLYAREPGTDPGSWRVFSGGVWLTERYDPQDEKRMRSVESSEERHEFAYDGDLVSARVVRLGGTGFSIERRSDGFVQATGLPGVRVDLDSDGNVQTIRDDSGPLADLTHFSPTGSGLRVVLHDGHEFESREASRSFVRQKLVASDGRLLFSGRFSPTAKRGGVSKFNFDLVREDLALPNEWGKGLSLTPSPTGHSDRIGRTGEKPIAWIVRGLSVGRGIVDVLCRADGNPIAYVMNLGGMMGGASSAPWRVVVTADRGISFEAPQSRIGSVISFWLRAGVFGYRVDPPSADGSPAQAP